MRMDINWADHVQTQLQIMVAGPDDLSPSHFLGGLMINECQNQRWQEGVDMIYRLLKSGILKMVGAKEGDDLSDFFQGMAAHNPFNLDNDGVVIWMGQLLYASEKCKIMMRKYGLDNYDALICPAFIEEMEALFETVGVPWSATPLLPILPAKS